MANCAGSTLSKHNKGLILVLTQHTVLAVVQTQHRTYLHAQHTALAVLQTQHGAYMHNTLCWQYSKHNTGLTHIAHCGGSSINTHAYNTVLTYASHYMGSSGDAIQD